MSNPDSGPIPLDAPGRHRRRLQFDPTINAGHVLTFVGMLTALFVGWTSLDKRVVVLEVAEVHRAQAQQTQDVAVREKIEDVKALIRDLQQSVNELRKQQLSK